MEQLWCACHLQKTTSWGKDFGKHMNFGEKFFILPTEILEKKINTLGTLVSLRSKKKTWCNPISDDSIFLMKITTISMEKILGFLLKKSMIGTEKDELK